MSIIILPELPQNQWDLSAWLQKMGPVEPGGASSFTNQDSEATMVIQVWASQVRDAVRQILGYSWADDEFPWEIHREYCPIQHPRYPQLWADSVSVSDEVPMVNTAFASGASAGQAKEYSQAFIGYGPDYFAKYAYSYITVRFKPIKNYRLFADYDNGWLPFAGKEWLRYFGRMGSDVKLDLITAEGAVDDTGLRFAEGNATQGVPATGPSGTPFGGAVFVRKETMDFHMVWRQVPINYTCGETILTEAGISSFLMPEPTRLVRALGTLNSAAFPGSASPYAPGVLMLTSVRETLYQQPLRTDSEFGLMAADYEMTFSRFDPPRDPDNITNPPATTPVARGHYLFPRRQTRYWYLATSGTDTTRGTYNGRYYYDSTNFEHMFYARDNTAIP